MYSTLASLLNLRLLEESRYAILDTQGPFELRLYQRMTCAKMSLTGPYDEVIKTGIGYLEEYLDGNNLRVEKISHSRCIFKIRRDNSWEVGAVLPPDYNVQNSPKPINRMIRISELPPAKFAALGFKGTSSPDLFARRAEDLKKWVEFKRLHIKGPLRIMRVSATSLPFFRNYEVHYELF